MKYNFNEYVSKWVKHCFFPFHYIRFEEKEITRFTITNNVIGNGYCYKTFNLISNIKNTIEILMLFKEI